MIRNIHGYQLSRDPIAEDHRESLRRAVARSVRLYTSIALGLVDQEDILAGRADEIMQRGRS